MSNVCVTSIPFDELKKGHRLQGADGTLGTIMGTDVVLDEHIGEEDERQVVFIIWSEDQAISKAYDYEILSKVIVIGEPATNTDVVILTSAEYDEETRLVDTSILEVGRQFYVDGELIDINLTDDGYLSFMSHDVVVVVPVGVDPDAIDEDIFNYIYETIRFNLIVTEGEGLNLLSVAFNCT
jgi:hypothetical protein